jgi:preprotein translocase subunit SecA
VVEFLTEVPIRGLIRKVFGSANERALRRLRPLIESVNALEAETEKKTAEDLRRRTGELRQAVEKGESLDTLLPEAFAMVREAAKRTLGQRHFDMQLLGGIVLHQGKIAEMKTGEGKTLVATLPTYLNALTGRGVHIVTVNDYLARRDAEWMGTIYRYLGLDVGCVVHGISEEDRRRAYEADVTYGQNNEFGFDYLRDNMKPSLELCVQPEHHFAIVDEVDSILVDEARTPLIISGPVEDDPEKFRRIDRLIPKLKAEAHYTVDEKARQVLLTDDGVMEVEKLLGVDNLYSLELIDTVHVVQNALRAHALYKRDVDYVVKDGQVVIVDEFTGRLMEGRRWSDGLHQAVEAHEGVKIQNESQTYASITFQNYFRMYEKLAGMTGTADTEAEEFHKIYKLDVAVIPTNQPMIRDDRADLVYRTDKEKWTAVIEEIEDCRKRGQPALVGTIAIETSEALSKRLKAHGFQHNVLNAKHHEREAEIIAQAGRLGSVTVSTNMAGRGTDIVLGGNPEMMLKARGLNPDDPEVAEELERLRAQCGEERERVLEAGGLHIVGTERHESRRIDNQLRGRSGRQGDPGSSRFFLSLEDNLLRIFGSDRIAPLMKRLGMEEGEPIEHKMVSRAIARAQAKVEARNFDIRKHLLEYDDVMNRQRESIYGWRRDVLSKDDLREDYLEMAEEISEEIVDQMVPEKGEADREGLVREVDQQFGIRIVEDDEAFRIERGEMDRDRVRERLATLVAERLEYQEKMFSDIETQFPDLRPPSFTNVARGILLQNLDQQWKDHLLGMDYLREGTWLRGYGQRDPKLEYQREGYEMFLDMNARVRAHAVSQLFRIVLETPSEERLRAMRVAEERRRKQIDQLQAQHPGSVAPETPQTVRREGRKVGRNEPCPCGSGKKYKKCHGAAA